MHRLTCLIVVLLASRTAHAEPRCVGWAVPGAVVGSVAVPIAVLGTMKLAGDEPNRSQHVDAIAGGAMIAGTIAGPIASCAAFGDEPHAVPAASFVVGGAIVGGLVAGGLTFEASCSGGRNCGGDPGAAVALSALALTAGAVAGGLGGYYLHVRVFGSESVVAPMAAPGMAAIVVGGRF